jgi:uncharacterized protein (TIGR02118 family)
MARVVVMFRTPKDTAAFDAHYFETHVALAKMLPGLRRYDILQGPGAIDNPDFHLVATFYFDDAFAANWALDSPEGKAAEADRRLFVPDDNDVLIFMVDSYEMEIESPGSASCPNLTGFPNHLLS